MISIWKKKKQNYKKILLTLRANKNPHSKQLWLLGTQ